MILCHPGGITRVVCHSVLTKSWEIFVQIRQKDSGRYKYNIQRAIMYTHTYVTYMYHTTTTMTHHTYGARYGTRFQPHVSCRVYTALLALLSVLAYSSVMYCYVLCVMVCAGCESYIIHNWHSSCRCVLHGGQGHVIVLWGLEYMFGLVCLCLFRRSWLKWGYDDT